MKIEDYETAHALMNEKKEILILDKIFSKTFHLSMGKVKRKQKNKENMKFLKNGLRS